MRESPHGTGPMTQTFERYVRTTASEPVRLLHGLYRSLVLEPDPCQPHALLFLTQPAVQTPIGNVD